MRIPMGNFGQQGPAPVQHTRINTQGADAALRAAQRLGDTGVQVAAGLQEARRQQDDALTRARAGNALLDREIQVKTLAADLEEQLAAGALRYDQAEQAYAEGLGRLEMPALDPMDPVTAENFSRGLKRAEFAGLGSVRTSAERARRAEFKGQTDNALDRMGKLAGMPDADIDKLNGQVEALDPIGRIAYGPQWEKVKQDFRDRNWTNHAVQAAMSVRDNPEALRELERHLTASDGFYANKLDTEKRNGVLRQVQNDRARIEARIQHQADRRETKAERVLGAIDQQIASGIPATAEMWARWSDEVSGTTHEAGFRERIEAEAQVQALLREPIEVQRAHLQREEQRLATQGGSVREQANLTRMKTAFERNIKLMEDAPLLFAQNRTGQAVPPLDFTALLDPQRMGEVQEQMRDRVATIEALRRQYGPQVQMRPLLPQESALLVQALGQSSTRQQVELFGALSQALGDDAAYMAAMQQIAPDSPVKALAGMLYQKQRDITLQRNWIRDDVTATSGDVAATILEGEAILNKTRAERAEDGRPKAFPLPPEKDFVNEFSAQAGRVFAGRPQAYELAAQAVRAYYTGRAAEEGDVSGLIDGRRMKQAITAVLGEVVDYNGNGEVLAPWGMDKSTFRAKVREAFTAEVKRRDMPETLLDQLPALGLKNRGDGSYYVVQGRNFLYDKSGAPLMLDLNRPDRAGPEEVTP